MSLNNAVKSNGNFEQIHNQVSRNALSHPKTYVYEWISKHNKKPLSTEFIYDDGKGLYMWTAVVKFEGKYYIGNNRTKKGAECICYEKIISKINLH